MKEVKLKLNNRKLLDYILESSDQAYNALSGDCNTYLADCCDCCECCVDSDSYDPSWSLVTTVYTDVSEACEVCGSSIYTFEYGSVTYYACTNSISFTVSMWVDPDGCTWDLIGSVPPNTPIDLSVYDTADQFCKLVNKTSPSISISEYTECPTCCYDSFFNEVEIPDSAWTLNTGDFYTTEESACLACLEINPTIPVKVYKLTVSDSDPETPDVDYWVCAIEDIKWSIPAPGWEDEYGCYWYTTESFSQGEEATVYVYQPPPPPEPPEEPEEPTPPENPEDACFSKLIPTPEEPTTEIDCPCCQQSEAYDPPESAWTVGGLVYSDADLFTSETVCEICASSQIISFVFQEITYFACVEADVCFYLDYWLDDPILEDEDFGCYWVTECLSFGETGTADILASDDPEQDYICLQKFVTAPDPEITVIDCAGFDCNGEANCSQGPSTNCPTHNGCTTPPCGGTDGSAICCYDCQSTGTLTFGTFSLASGADLLPYYDVAVDFVDKVSGDQLTLKNGVDDFGNWGWAAQGKISLIDATYAYFWRVTFALSEPCGASFEGLAPLAGYVSFMGICRIPVADYVVGDTPPCVAEEFYNFISFNNFAVARPFNCCGFMELPETWPASEGHSWDGSYIDTSSDLEVTESTFSSCRNCDWEGYPEELFIYSDDCGQEFGIYVQSPFGRPTWSGDWFFPSVSENVDCTVFADVSVGLAFHPFLGTTRACVWYALIFKDCIYWNPEDENDPSNGSTDGSCISTGVKCFGVDSPIGEYTDTIFVESA